MANRRISELPSIEGNQVGEQDLFTLVHVFEVDPSLKNKKITISGYKDYLNTYYLTATGGTLYGSLDIQNNLTVQGTANISGITTSGSSIFSTIIVQTTATVSGTISGATITGNNLNVSNALIGTGNFTLASGTTANFVTLSGTTITGGTINVTTTNITSGIFAAGSAAAPSIAFTGDTDTGIYSTGANQLAISTNGTGRLFVDATGVVVSGTLSRNGFNVVTVGDVGTVTSTMIASGTIIDANVNISGAINATKLNFLQAGTGATARTVDSKLKEVVSVKDFGAVGDGVADDTAAIQAALNYGATGGYTVTAAGTFKISSKVTIKGNADFSNAIFNVYSTPAIALEISTGNASNPTTILYNAVIYLPKVLNNTTKPATGWVGQGIGVRTVNTHSCQIFFGRIVGFDTGILCTAYNTGNVFTTHYLGVIENNKQNLRLEPGNSAGWVNSNTYIGGALKYYSSEGVRVAGAYHINIENSVTICNHHLFLNISVESDVPEYNLRCAGSYNIFQQLRWETTGLPMRVLFFGTNANHGTRNMILGGYDIEALEVTYSGTTGLNNVLFGAATTVFETGSGGVPLRYQNVSSAGSPIRRFYSTTPGAPWANGSDWTVSESAIALEGKQPGDTYPRIKLDYTNGRLYVGNAAVALAMYFESLGSIALGASANFCPITQNNLSLGIDNYRWSTAYLFTAPIVTSDQKNKQDISSLDDAEHRVAVALKGLIKKFRLKDSVQTKGDEARIHIGVIAQEVIAAFQSESLNPFRYGMVCHDEWDATFDESGSEISPAGEIYSIRYEELLAFIISAL